MEYLKSELNIYVLDVGHEKKDKWKKKLFDSDLEVFLWWADGRVGYLKHLRTGLLYFWIDRYLFCKWKHIQCAK